MFTCPNKSFKSDLSQPTSDWQMLIDKAGSEASAYTIYTANDFNIPSNIENLTINDLQYQKSYDTDFKDAVVAEKAIRELGARLSSRIGIPITYERKKSDPYKGKLIRGRAYINLAYATLDTPVHEVMGHPIIRAIKNVNQKTITSDDYITTFKLGNDKYSDESNVDGGWWKNGKKITQEEYNEAFEKYSSLEKQLTTLYKNLLKELEYGRGKEVLDRIKRDYNTKDTYKQYAVYDSDSEQIAKDAGAVYHETTEDGEQIWVKQEKYSLEEQQEEAIVELLGLYTADRLDKAKDASLITLLRRFLREIKDFVRDLIRQKEIRIETLPDNMTIGDIADILAYSNSKIILPGNSVIYTTPDGVRFKSYTEASNHITKLFKESKDIDLDDVQINLELSQEALLEIERLEAEKQSLIDYFQSNKYQEDKASKLKDLQEQLAVIEAYPPAEFTTQEIYLTKEDIEKFDLNDYSYVRIENTYTRGNIYHADILGKDYTGFYIHAYKAQAFPLDYVTPKKIVPISRKQAEEMWAKDPHSRFNSVEQKQKYYRLVADIKDIENDIKIKRSIHNIGHRINNIRSNDNTLKGFIDKNRQYEQSLDIIETWKKENNIVYNPEEVYSRNQGFYSAIGAYSQVELDLLLQNLLQHIEDNKKAGGRFAVSAFTKPTNIRVSHLEEASSVQFVIYPKPEDILWAAPTDVYSGSVWSASKSVAISKKSELVGVTHTKAPGLNNLGYVSPNLADIIDSRQHHHNELGIELTTTNFRLEVDENVPYEIKKLVDSVNSILDQRYGKLEKPNISIYKKGTKLVNNPLPADQRRGVLSYDSDANGGYYLDTIEAYHRRGYAVGDKISPVNVLKILKQVYPKDEVTLDPITKHVMLNGEYAVYGNNVLVYETPDKIEEQDFGIAPTKTRENTKNIEELFPIGIENHDDEGNYWYIADDIKYASSQDGTHYKATKASDGSWRNWTKISRSEYEKNRTKDKKEYTKQALINLRVARLKEVAKKYPRSLISSKVINNISFDNPHPYNIGVGGFVEIDAGTWEVDMPDDLPFQKVPGLLSDMLQNASNKRRILNRYFNIADHSDYDNTDPIELLDSIIENLQDDSIKNVLLTIRKAVANIDGNSIRPAIELTNDAGIKSLTKDGSSAYALYNQNTGVIYINTDSMDRHSEFYFQQTVAHELIHFFTVEPFAKKELGLPLSTSEQKFYDRIYALFIVAKRQASDKDAYGYEDPIEFISEVMTNPTFVKDLQSKKYNVFERAWFAILEFISNMAGIYKVNPSKIYEQSSKLIDEFIFRKDKVNDYMKLEMEEDPRFISKRKNEAYRFATREEADKYITEQKVGNTVIFTKDGANKYLVKNKDVYKDAFNIIGEINAKNKQPNTGADMITRLGKTPKGYSIKIPFGYFQEESRMNMGEFRKKQREANEHIIPLDTYDKRDPLSHLERENEIDLAEKIAVLNAVFPGFKIVTDSSETVMGSNIARLEGKNKVIRINPNLLTKDAIGHEYGHILVDTIGGLDNALIKAGLAFLKGTALEMRINEVYADESDNKRAKELITQAIGEDFSRQFDEQKLGKWEQWLLRFFRRIKELLGLESKEVRKLAEILLKGEELQPQVEDLIYEKREPTSLSSKALKEAEELRRKALEVMTTKSSIYGEKGRVAAIEKIEKVRKELEDSDKTDIAALTSFAKQAYSNIKSAHNEILRLQALKRDMKEGDENPFNAFQLTRLYDFVNGYRLVEDIYRGVVKEKGKNSKKLDNFWNKALTMLSESIDMKRSIEAVFLEEGFDIVVDFLLPMYTRVEAQFKLDKTREFNTINKESVRRWKKDKSYNKKLEQYLKEEYYNNEDNIKAQSRSAIEKELKVAKGDINKIMAYAETILDSNDSIIATLVKQLAITEHESRQEKIAQVTFMVSKLRELETQLGAEFLKNEKTFYDFMLEKLPDGTYTQRYVEEYYSSFWTDYANFKTKINENEDLTDEQKTNAIRNWKEINAPLDKKAFAKELSAFVDMLYQGFEVNGKMIKISEDELAAYNFNSAIRKHKLLGEQTKPITEIFNEDAAEQYIYWIRSNTWKHRKIVDKYKNPQWENLKRIREQNPEDARIKFFDHVVDVGKLTDQMLPYKYRLGSRLPGVTKDYMEKIYEGQSPITAIFSTVEREAGIAEDETERGRLIDPNVDEKTKKADLKNRVKMELIDESGNVKQFLPIYYSARLTDAEQSYDIATIYTHRYNMATDYAHKYNILPEVELTKKLLEQREYTKRDSDGSPILNALFKKEDNVEKREPFSESNLMIQLEAWMKSIVYGDREEFEGTLFGGRLDIGKAANLINKYTALNLLGMNFVQGIANYILGESMQIIDAFAGEHYTMKDYHWAKVKYNTNIFGIIGDIGMRRPTNIINLLNEKFDTINDFGIGKLRKNTRFRNLMSSDALFFTSHAGEHMMQTKVMLAMLHRIKPLDREGNEIKDENGKVIENMFDAYQINKRGILELNPQVANFEEAKFELKVKRILSRMHGEYSDLGRVAMQRYALGRMAYMFRKFVIQGYKRRWETGYRDEAGILQPKYNELGEFFSEGAYISFGRFVKNLMPSLLKFQFSLITENWDTLHDYEKANIKRTLGEIAFLLTALILGGMFMAKMKDDDDEEWIWGFLAYQAARYKSELLFWTPKLDEAMSILRSPAASMSVLENLIKLTGQVFDPFDVYESGDWKGRLKIEKTLTNMVPVYRQYYRIVDVSSQIPFFKQTQLFEKAFSKKVKEENKYEKFKEYYGIE